MGLFTLLGTALLGLAAGGIAGMIGIGGGVLIVPALVLLFGFDQHTAQGTSLALLLPPIGVLAVMEYYRNGYVDLRVALIMAALFVVGSFLGARLAVSIDSALLRKIFAGFLFLVSVRMFFG